VKDYAVTVTGTSPAGTTRSGTANIHVYDFGITAAVSPASPAYACTFTPAPCLYVLSTGSNWYGVNAQLLPGSSVIGLPQVGLTLTGAPSGTLYSYTPNPGTPTFASNLTLTTTNTLPGSYTLTVMATDSRPEGGFRSIPVSLVVVTPQQALQLVLNQVSAFQAGGAINKGQANALTVKLDQVIAYLNSGNTKNACLQMSAFSNKGFLTPQESSLLLGGPLGVYAVMKSLSC